MKNHLGMKKVCTRWVPKLLTPVQLANRMDCCGELLQQSEEDLVMKLGCATMILSLSWKARPGRDQDGVLLIDYLPRGAIMNGQYYALIIERLHSVLLEKHRNKVYRGVLLLHDNLSVHKSNIAQAAIQQNNFIELNHPAYSQDIAPSDHHLPGVPKVLRHFLFW
ncbi:unnamed protein product [Adineta ricciae]|uniref:Transposase n=1 Tax=Adineta ricciae TaxID=249248 RepID=A0A815VFP7_ADIRI|nr:unnamed protein product [Adineta ricciae]CAF1570156.1 unnamed protein product [Adineta ricciae]